MVKTVKKTSIEKTNEFLFKPKKVVFELSEFDIIMLVDILSKGYNSIDRKIMPNHHTNGLNLFNKITEQLKKQNL